MFGMIGKKVGMTQIFTSDGIRHAVTVVEVPDSVVLQIKTEQTDGYNAIQLGCFPQKNPNKPMQGHFAKAGKGSFKVIREFRVDNPEEFEVGQALSLERMQKGDVLNVVGTSKGAGFQGVVKRYNFAGGPRAHGSSKFHRRAGSIGMHTDPGRVFKGHKMPGHKGNRRVTVPNLVIMAVDSSKNLMFLRGTVPGPNGGVVSLNQVISLKDIK